MRLESLQPTTESEFYARLSTRTFGSIFWERVEPADESGFPDAYVVIQDRIARWEGTIELKYSDNLEPNLRSLARGTQKAALINYQAAGGRRRFALCYCMGRVYLWNTLDFLESIRGQGRGWTSSEMLEASDFTDWLVKELMQNG